MISIFAELFFTFFKIGLFTFGGGYAMLPLIQSEVLAKGWLSAEELLDFVAVAESTPGPFAINISTYIGSQTGGFVGALCATSGVVLPSFIVILLVARVYTAFQKSRIVEGMFAGLRPMVVGLIASAALTMAMTVFFPAGLRQEFTMAMGVSLVIFAASLAALMKKVHPIAVIAGSAAIGIVCGYLGVWG